MAYLRYSDDIETIQPDEQESIDGIITGMTQQTEMVEKREHHAVRASHAKSSALIGELTIANDLPSELVQDLFAKPGTHPVAIRFAQEPGETLGDRVSTHRGMAIKVFGVEGAFKNYHRRPGDEPFGIVGTAAAVANTICHATGKRVRSLPITIDNLLETEVLS